jgi:hypothetical protein
MAEEQKLTLKVSIIASGVAALIVMMGGALWSHQTDIATIRANQNQFQAAIIRLQEVPERLTKIEGQIELLSAVQGIHRDVSNKNFKMLKGIRTNGAR